jgi:tubulin alpha
MPGAVKECICVQIGQAGCQIGEKVWELFCKEHKIGPDGKAADYSAGLAEDSEEHAYESFFNETSGSQFVPRTIFIDTDPASKDCLKASQFKSLFHPECMVTYKRSCMGVFSEGMMMGNEYMMVDNAMNAIDKQVDLCENLQGFFVMHAVGGGCGSGLGASILKEMRTRYAKQCIYQPLIYPSQNMANSIVEPYNCVLATHHIHSGNDNNGYCDMTMLMDNEQAYKVAKRNLKIPNPTFCHLNKIIAQIISGATTSLRFPCMLNASLHEVVTNLVPDKKYRYTSVSFAPIRHRDHSKHESLSTEAIIKELFEEYNAMCDIRETKSNRYLAACIMLRGKEWTQNDDGKKVLAPIAVTKAMKSVTSMREPSGSSHRSPVKFLPWVQGGFKVGVVGEGPTSPGDFEMAPTERAGCMMANTTAIRQVFVRQYVRFLKLSYRKAYFDQFISCGLEPSEFTDAQDTMRGIIDSYEELLGQCAEQENEHTSDRVEILPEQTKPREGAMESTRVPDDSR